MKMKKKKKIVASLVHYLCQVGNDWFAWETVNFHLALPIEKYIKTTLQNLKKRITVKLNKQ